MNHRIHQAIKKAIRTKICAGTIVSGMDDEHENQITIGAMVIFNGSGLNTTWLNSYLHVKSNLSDGAWLINARHPSCWKWAKCYEP